MKEHKSVCIPPRKKRKKKNNMLGADNCKINDNQIILTTTSYIPLFKYKLRLIKNREIREDVDKNGIKFMPWIKTPVSWVSLRLR